MPLTEQPSYIEPFLNWLFQYVDHPIHFTAELILFVVLIYIYSIKSYKPVNEALTETEEEELIADWNPEPLIKKDLTKISSHLPPSRIVESGAGPHVQISGEDCLNMVSHGVLGFQVHPKVIEEAIKCTDKYGVGACGPRGFYGSIEPHMELEKKLAQFMGTEDSIIFSSEFQTIASVIPAFAKPGDYCICDKGVCLAIQNGLTLSRSTIKWFNHNDMSDLKRVLHSLSEVFSRKKNRVFLIVESIYANFGDILHLDEILEFKKKFPFRIILEESLSIGVLGKTGRGLTEHFGVPTSSVEIVASSIGNALGSVGGFACGTSAITSHMRLNCSGYVFSCSLPPYAASACISSLNLLETGPHLSQLHRSIEIAHRAVKKIPNLKTTSSPHSPFIHLRLTKSTGSRSSDDALLQGVVDLVLERGKVAITRSQYVSREAFMPEPSIKVVVGALHTEQEITEGIGLIGTVLKEILKK